MILSCSSWWLLTGVKPEEKETFSATSKASSPLWFSQGKSAMGERGEILFSLSVHLCPPQPLCTITISSSAAIKLFPPVQLPFAANISSSSPSITVSSSSTCPSPRPQRRTTGWSCIDRLNRRRYNAIPAVLSASQLRGPFDTV